jgi:hypothetical protein
LIRYVVSIDFFKVHDMDVMTKSQYWMAGASVFLHI